MSGVGTPRTQESFLTGWCSPNGIKNHHNRIIFTYDWDKENRCTSRKVRLFEPRGLATSAYFVRNVTLAYFKAYTETVYIIIGK